MKAADLLQSFERCYAVFHNASGWLSLLRIAVAGDAGIIASRAGPSRSGRKGHLSPAAIRRWERSGIIEIIKRPFAVNRYRKLIRITPRGLRLLGCSASAQSSQSS